MIKLTGSSLMNNLTNKEKAFCEHLCNAKLCTWNITKNARVAFDAHQAVCSTFYRCTMYSLLAWITPWNFQTYIFQCCLQTFLLSILFRSKYRTLILFCSDLNLILHCIINGFLYFRTHSRHLYGNKFQSLLLTFPL